MAFSVPGRALDTDLEAEARPRTPSPGNNPGSKILASHSHLLFWSQGAVRRGKRQVPAWQWLVCANKTLNKLTSNQLVRV